MKCLLKALFTLTIACLTSLCTASDITLNLPALHTDGSGFAMGGLLTGMGSTKDRIIGITYLQPYLLKGLSTRRVRLDFQASGMQWGIAYNQSGEDPLMEHALSLVVSRNLHRLLRFGFRLNGLWMDFPNAGTSFLLFPEIESQYQLSTQAGLALLLVNPWPASWLRKGTSSWVGSSAQIGIQLRPSRHASFFGETGINLTQPLEGRLGMEYILDPRLILRSGCSFSPFKPTWGAGGMLGKVRYAWGGSLHPTLGLSQCITVEYIW